jgi:hypothetical protein
MGEARRRKQNAAQSSAGAVEDAPLPSDQASFLQDLSAWNDAHPWEPPPAEPRPVPASEVMVYLVDTSNLWNVVGGVPEEGMKQLIAHAESAPPSLYQRAPGLAGMALLKAAAAGARLSDMSCQNALTFAGFYLDAPRRKRRRSPRTDRSVGTGWSSCTTCKTVARSFGQCLLPPLMRASWTHRASSPRCSKS